MRGNRIICSLIESIFPNRCLACGELFNPSGDTSEEPVSSAFKQAMAGWLCPSCIGGFSSIQSPFCSQCGVMFNSRIGTDHICGECLTSEKHFRIARAAGIYDQSLMKTIHAFKYDGKIQLAKPFGELLLMAFLKYWQDRDIHLAAPVPLHIRRMRERGFNQAFLMIKDWIKTAAGLNLPISIQIDNELLIRNRRTQPQTRLNREQRKQNLKGAFTVVDPAKIKGKRILLIDDVLTTGATVNECAKVLKSAGAEYVDVLTLARAMR